MIGSLFEQGGDYVFALMGVQGTPFEDVELLWDDLEESRCTAYTYYTGCTVDKNTFASKLVIFGRSQVG